MPKKIRGRSALLAVAALALGGAVVTLAQPPARTRIDDKVLHLDGAKADQPYLVLRQTGTKAGSAEYTWVVAGSQATLPLARSLGPGERITVYTVEPKATCGLTGCRQCTPKECPVPPPPEPFLKLDPVTKPSPVIR